MSNQQCYLTLVKAGTDGVKLPGKQGKLREVHLLTHVNKGKVYKDTKPKPDIFETDALTHYQTQIK